MSASPNDQLPPVQTPPPISTATPGSATNTASAGTPTATQYDPSTYTATPYTVSPNATVASQIKDIVASGSPLMQQAEANAKDMAQQKGLLNSSMAVTAGQTGLLNAALPIASADAATWDRAATNTSTAANQASQFNSTAANQALSAYATQQNSLQQTRMNNESAIQIQNLQNEGNLANIRAQGVINVQLTELQNANKLLLQSNAGAAQLYAQALTQMGAISTNPNLSQDQKANALNNMVMMTSDGLHIMSQISSTPDVASLLNFSDEEMGRGPNDPGTSGGGGGGGGGDGSNSSGGGGGTDAMGQAFQGAYQQNYGYPYNLNQNTAP
jgi:hypothetical protein